MSTLTASAPAVKSSRPRRPVVMHPLTPTGREPRPFGVGLVNLTRAERLAESSARLARMEAEHEAEARSAGVGPRQLDAAWHAGASLGRDGVEAIADRALTYLERRAFRQGYEAGESERAEGLALDAWEVAGFETIEDAEWHSMSMSPPAVPYCFA